MPEQYAGQPLSRSVYLALQDEQRLVRDGYEFLDEKRILLAAELLKQRDRYRALRDESGLLQEAAATALQQAVSQHGLDGLLVQPPLDLAKAQLRTLSRPYVGQVILDSRLETGDALTAPPSVHPSPEVRACTQAFLQLLTLAAQLAACSCNIHRLRREYQRTERRTRALENVILPELTEALAQAEGYLEMLDQEEVMRVRFRKGGN